MKYEEPIMDILEFTDEDIRTDLVNTSGSGSGGDFSELFS